MATLALDQAQALVASLEAVGECDIVPLFFARLFAAHPAEERNFHNRASSQGTMVNQMLEFLLAQAEGQDWLPTMVQTQVLTHHDKGDIALERWRDCLELLVDVLGEAAGPRWTPAFEHAWREQTRRLYALVCEFY